MERTSRGGGRVLTNINESHEMRRNGEKFCWDLKVLKIPQGDKIPRDFSPINANASTILLGFAILNTLLQYPERFQPRKLERTTWNMKTM